MTEHDDLATRVTEYLSTNTTPPRGLEGHIMHRLDTAARHRRLAARTVGTLAFVAAAAASVTLVTAAHTRQTTLPVPATSASPSSSAVPTASPAPTSHPQVTPDQLVAVAKATYWATPGSGHTEFNECDLSATCPFTAAFHARLVQAGAAQKDSHYDVLCHCQQYTYGPASYVATLAAGGGSVTVTMAPDGRQPWVFVLTEVNEGGRILVDGITVNQGPDGGSCGGTIDIAAPSC